jgi:hypothetical protein
MRCRRLALVVALLGSVAAVAQGPGPADGVGYPSVEAAFRALKADRDSVVTMEPDWMVFTRQERGGVTTVYRFTRPGHPAHPSVERVRTDPANGETGRAMLCQSRDARACAALDARTRPNG